MGMDALSLKVQELELELEEARGQLMQAMQTPHQPPEEAEVCMGCIFWAFGGHKF